MTPLNISLRHTNLRDLSREMLHRRAVTQRVRFYEQVRNDNERKVKSRSYFYQNSENGEQSEKKMNKSPRSSRFSPLRPCSGDIHHCPNRTSEGIFDYSASGTIWISLQQCPPAPMRRTTQRAYWVIFKLLFSVITTQL